MKAIDSAVSELDGSGVGGSDGWVVLAHAVYPLFFGRKMHRAQ
jgi:hypothetical protein